MAVWDYPCPFVSYHRPRKMIAPTKRDVKEIRRTWFKIIDEIHPGSSEQCDCAKENLNNVKLNPNI